jgi:hypothetical protein
MATIDYLQLFPQSILNRLTTSNIGKLWTMFADEVDEIESALTQMKTMFDIDSAEGKQLDQIGKNVNFARLASQSDADYRLYLKIAILEKLSGGSNSDMTEIIALVIPDYVNAQILELYPGNIYAWVQIEDARPLSDEADIISLIKAAGINFYLTNTIGTPFVFDGDDDGEGFSDTGDLTAGGMLAEVF